MIESKHRLDCIETPIFEEFSGQFIVSYRIKKGSGSIYMDRGITTLRYFSLSGITEECPVTSYSVTEYGTEIPYDYLDLIVELTTEQLIRLKHPDLDLEFGY